MHGRESSIPVNAILAISALLVAVFVVAASMNRWRLPLISTAMLVVVALVAGGHCPWIVQRFQVVPNEQGAQSKFIQRNIDATRYAYGLTRLRPPCMTRRLIPCGCVELFE